MSKKLFLALSCAFMLLNPLSSSADHGPLEEGAVHIGVDNSSIIYSYNALFTFAKEAGTFEQHDIDARIVNTSNVGYECAAVRSETVDFGGHAYVLKQCSDDLVAVAAITDIAPYYVVVRKGIRNGYGKEVNTIADTGGLKLVTYGCGIKGTGLAGRLFFDVVSKIEGLGYKCPTPPDKVDGLDPDAVHVMASSGIKNGHLQAKLILDGNHGLAGGIVLPRLKEQLVSTGDYKVLMGPSGLNDYGRAAPVALLHTRQSMLTEYPDVVRRVVAALQDTFAYALEHPEWAKGLFQVGMPELDAQRVDAVYQDFIEMTPPNLCMEEGAVRRGIQFYAVRTKEELPLTNAVRLVSCDE